MPASSFGSSVGPLNELEKYDPGENYSRLGTKLDDLQLSHLRVKLESFQDVCMMMTTTFGIHHWNAELCAYDFEDEKWNTVGKLACCIVPKILFAQPDEVFYKAMDQDADLAELMTVLHPSEEGYLKFVSGEPETDSDDEKGFFANAWKHTSSAFNEAGETIHCATHKTINDHIGDVMFIKRVEIDPEYRGAGVGRFFVQYVMNQLVNFREARVVLRPRPLQHEIEEYAHRASRRQMAEDREKVQLTFQTMGFSRIEGSNFWALSRNHDHPDWWRKCERRLEKRRDAKLSKKTLGGTVGSPERV